MKKFKHFLIMQRLGHTTVQDLSRHTENYLSWLEEEGITSESYNDLLAYVRQLKERKVSAASINNRLNGIRHWYNYQIKEGIREDNPAWNLRVKGAVKKVRAEYYKKEELEEMYTAFTEYDNLRTQNDRKAHKQYCVMLGFVMYQGLTTNDLTNLEVTDLNLMKGTVDLVGGRKSNERTLKLEPSQVMLLASHIEDKTGHLFNMRVSDAIGRIDKKLSKMMREKITMNNIRASRIILWLQEHNVRQVQYFTGMRHASSLEQYQKSNLEGLKEQVKKFHPLS